MKLLISIGCFSIAIILASMMDGCSSSGSRTEPAAFHGSVYSATSFNSVDTADASLSYIPTFNMYFTKFRLGTLPVSGRGAAVRISCGRPIISDIFDGSQHESWSWYKDDGLVFFFDEFNLPSTVTCGNAIITIYSWEYDNVGTKIHLSLVR